MNYAFNMTYIYIKHYIHRIKQTKSFLENYDFKLRLQSV